MFTVQWDFDNQIKSGLLIISESASEIVLDRWIFSIFAGKKMNCVLHFLSTFSSAVAWHIECTRQPPSCL